MKPVIGLLLIFVGLSVGYLVITGQLPASAPVATGANVTGSAIPSQNTANTTPNSYPASGA